MTTLDTLSCLCTRPQVSRLKHIVSDVTPGHSGSGADGNTLTKLASRPTCPDEIRTSECAVLKGKMPTEAGSGILSLGWPNERIRTEDSLRHSSFVCLFAMLPNQRVALRPDVRAVQERR